MGMSIKPGSSPLGVALGVILLLVGITVPIGVSTLVGIPIGVGSGLAILGRIPVSVILIVIPPVVVLVVPPGIRWSPSLVAVDGVAPSPSTVD